MNATRSHGLVGLQTAVWLLLGVLPSGVFFVWLALECSLPWVPGALGLPWLELRHWPLAALVAWNVGLFGVFGAVHSLSAAPDRPERERRRAYVIGAGVSLTLVMALWQSTGVILWSVGGEATRYLGLALTLGLLGLGGWSLRGHRLAVFLGWRAPASATPPQLLTSGVYGWVRHPLYLCVLAASLASFHLSLDRALVALGQILYLSVGIPIEERRLVALFGDAYRDYQRRVPALIPWQRAGRLFSALKSG